MKPLDASDADITRRFQQRFAATVTNTADGFRLQFPGVSESFELSTEHDEFTVFTSSWHEHFSDIDSLEPFFAGLLSGGVEVVVTYRGQKPVAHQIRRCVEGDATVVSRTAVLVSPFWRRKSHRTIRYTPSA